MMTPNVSWKRFFGYLIVTGFIALGCIHVVDKNKSTLSGGIMQRLSPEISKKIVEEAEFVAHTHELNEQTKILVERALFRGAGIALGIEVTGPTPKNKT